MRQSKREVKDRLDILQILDGCDTIRLGLQGSDYPYVVPLSFGWEETDGIVTLYVHGAKEGKKHDLIAQNNRVCVEADRLIRYTDTGHSATAEYESVIGFGTIHVCDRTASIRGIDLLMQHCRLPGFSPEECVDLGITKVYAIRLTSFTGKRRTV